MLRHAAACLKLLVKGTIIFQKRHRFQKPDQNTVNNMPEPPANVNTAESTHKWACFYSSSSYFRFLSTLLTYMIAKWRNVSLLILRRSCVRMCPNKLKALST